MKRLMYFLLPLLILTACEPDDANDPSALRQRWILMTLQTSADVQPVAGTGPYVLDLRQAEHFSLGLDANRCNGEWSTAPDGKIDLSRFGCTYICCDSPFAEELSRLVRGADRYSLQNDQMRLYNEEGEEAWFLRER